MSRHHPDFPRDKDLRRMGTWFDYTEYHLIYIFRRKKAQFSFPVAKLVVQS